MSTQFSISKEFVASAKYENFSTSTTKAHNNRQFCDKPTFLSVVFMLTKEHLGKNDVAHRFFFRCCLLHLSPSSQQKKKFTIFTFHAGKFFFRAIFIVQISAESKRSGGERFKRCNILFSSWQMKASPPHSASQHENNSHKRLYFY